MEPQWRPEFMGSHRNEAAFQLAQFFFFFQRDA